MVVQPTLVPALKFQLAVEEGQGPVLPDHPPPVLAAAATAANRGIIDVVSSDEEEFL